MSETFWITLIVVAAVLIVLYWYREKLQSFFIEGGGVKTGMKTHKPAAPTANPQTPGVVVSSNVQKGSGHGITVAREAQVTDNRQTGKNNQINVQPDGKPSDPQA